MPPSRDQPAPSAPPQLRGSSQAAAMPPPPQSLQPHANANETLSLTPAQNGQLSPGPSDANSTKAPPPRPDTNTALNATLTPPTRPSGNAGTPLSPTNSTLVSKPPRPKPAGSPELPPNGGAGFPPAAPSTASSAPNGSTNENVTAHGAGDGGAERGAAGPQLVVLVVGTASVLCCICVGALVACGRRRRHAARSAAGNDAWAGFPDLSAFAAQQGDTARMQDLLARSEIYGYVPA